ncbi:3-hydroxyacyl-ACP dehydratase FabZ family protein [Roseococcus sp. DSY-14]|uniref:3-hydroxyacyl-ACP dehydratase FabZ family protein n=1 Tax=Roseococcus sp. DSY-14 TaxID=3369650 RepID=UPI00387B83BA
MRLETFEMLDRVLERGETRLRAACRIPEQSPVFEGHFPGFPLLPGVLMIEIMAQAAGWLLIERSARTRIAVLAKVGEAKMRGQVPPGAALEAEAELLHDGSGYAVLKGALRQEGRVVAEAELTLRTLPFPAPALEAAVQDRARALGL